MSNYKSVARNQGYTRAAVSHVEKHNERKNTNYSNVDVVLTQSYNNVHFKQCNSTYLAMFDKMVQDGEISTRGLKLNDTGTKKESSIIAELIFDVNTEYFENNYENHSHTSGYDFAKSFYAEAYKMAVAEVGDEKYILSATMHADERNKGLSEQLGRDIYHYHLHVVYIPVVQKKILYSKRIKDKSLVGKVKEVINQVSHSNKWESEKEIGDDGKERLIYSYSKLQDRYHNHMKAAGFKHFERGKMGSTAQNLSVLDYKTKIRQEELAEKEKSLEQKSQELLAVDEKLTIVYKQITQKENRLEKLTDKEKDIQERINSIEDSGQMLTLKQIEKIPTKIHAPLVGKSGVILAEEDEKSLRKMALATAKVNEKNKTLKHSLKASHETITTIIQAVNLLKYNFKKPDTPPAENLTQEQNILIETIRSYGEDFAKSYNNIKLVDDIKLAKLDGTMTEKFYLLEEEYQNKNKPSINKVLEAATLKAREQNENANAANRSQKHKSHSEER